MSEAGKREAGGEKERRIETGVMESRMYFFKVSFLYLPVLISGSCAGDESESSYCAVQEMGRLGP